MDRESWSRMESAKRKQAAEIGQGLLQKLLKREVQVQRLGKEKEQREAQQVDSQLLQKEATRSAQQLHAAQTSQDGLAWSLHV